RQRRVDRAAAIEQVAERSGLGGAGGQGGERGGGGRDIVLGEGVDCLAESGLRAGPWLLQRPGERGGGIGARPGLHRGGAEGVAIFAGREVGGVGEGTVDVALDPGSRDLGAGETGFVGGQVLQQAGGGGGVVGELLFDGG